MPLGTFGIGSYTATYAPATGTPGAVGGAVDLGLVEGVRRFQRTMEGRDIRADDYGDTVIDGIYRGGQCFLLMTFKEWQSAVKNAIWPFGTAFGDVGTVGRLLSDLAGQIVLTARTGTPAATNGPATLTFPKAIISPGHNSEVILGNEERNVPILFRCYPVDASGTIRWFTET